MFTNQSMQAGVSGGAILLNASLQILIALNLAAY